MVALRLLLRHPHRPLPFPSSSRPASLDPVSRVVSFPRQMRRSRPQTEGRSCWGSNAGSSRPGSFRVRDARDGGGRDNRGARGGVDEDEGSDHRRSRRRRWWSDDDLHEESYGRDDFSDLLENEVEQPWDKIWVLKVRVNLKCVFVCWPENQEVVFKSYGYLLPAIIASMLLATGPKAFLMALALPLGQSALSLLLDKLWGNGSTMTRPKSKSKKKPFSRSSNDFKREEDGYREKEARRSWTAADAVARNGKGSSHAFGGWDDLDQCRAHSEGSAKQQPPRIESASSSGAVSIKKGKLSRRKRKNVPLYLRLLIAVFPFLDSWIRIL